MPREAKRSEEKELCIVVEEWRLFPCILGKSTQVREKESQHNVRKFITSTIMSSVVNITSIVCYEINWGGIVNWEKYTVAAAFGFQYI